MRSSWGAGVVLHASCRGTNDIFCVRGCVIRVNYGCSAIMLEAG